MKRRTTCFSSCLTNSGSKGAKGLPIRRKRNGVGYGFQSATSGLTPFPQSTTKVQGKYLCVLCVLCGLKLQPMKFLSGVAGMVVFILLTGCVPFVPFLFVPHTTDRAPAGHGRVLDAKTHAPIEGAKVFFVEAPHHTTRSDAKGYFRLKAIRNFHWAYVSYEGHWPEGKDSEMEITHPNYLPYWGAWGGDAGDIFMNPSQ